MSDNELLDAISYVVDDESGNMRVMSDNSKSPFSRICFGVIQRDDEGYFIFVPQGTNEFNAKLLVRIALKLSDLNSNGDNNG